MTNQNSSTNKPQDVQQTAPIDTQANILFEAGLPARYLPTSPAASSRAIGLPLIIAIVAIGAIAAILISGIISARLLAQQSTPAAVAMLPTFTLTVTDTETDSSSFLKSTSIPLPVTQNAAAAANSTAIVTANAVPTTAIPTVQPTTAEAAVPPTNTPHPSPTDALTNTATATFTSTILPATISTSAATVNAIVAVTQAVTMNATVVTTQAATTSATIARTQAATMSATVGAASPVVIPSTVLAIASIAPPTATATDDPTCATAMAASLNTFETTAYTSSSFSSINLTSKKNIVSASYSDAIQVDGSEMSVTLTPNAVSNEKVTFNTTPLTKDKLENESIASGTTTRAVLTSKLAFIKLSIQLEGCNKNTEIFLVNAPSVKLEVGSSIQIHSTGSIPDNSQIAPKNIIAAFCMVPISDNKPKSCPDGNLYVIFLAKADELSSISDTSKTLPIYFIPVKEKPDATLQISDASAFKSAIFQQPKDAKGYVLIYAPASLVTQTPTPTATVKP